MSELNSGNSGYGTEWFYVDENNTLHLKFKRASITLDSAILIGIGLGALGLAVGYRGGLKTGFKQGNATSFISTATAYSFDKETVGKFLERYSMELGKHMHADKLIDVASDNCAVMKLAMNVDAVKEAAKVSAKRMPKNRTIGFLI